MRLVITQVYRLISSVVLAAKTLLYYLIQCQNRCFYELFLPQTFIDSKRVHLFQNIFSSMLYSK